MNPTPPKPPADALPEVKATPRTDAIGARYSPILVALENSGTTETVGATLKALCQDLIDNGRQLERELNYVTARKYVGPLSPHYEKQVERIAQLETELRSSEAALAEVRRSLEACDSIRIDNLADTHKAEAEVERLSKIYSIHKSDTMRQHFKVAEELLAEARRERDEAREETRLQLKACEAVEGAYRDLKEAADLVGSQLEASADDCLREHERGNKAEDRIAELKFQLIAIQESCERLTALRANAGEDSRLLDWLENEFAFVRLESEDEASVPYWIVYVPDGKDGEYGELARGITPREAIDAASRPETKGDNE